MAKLHGWATAGAALAGLTLAHGAPGLSALGPVRRTLAPRLAGIGRPGHVALTFDDGPDPATTPAFLEALAEHRVRATFFLLGTMTAAAPGLAAEIAAAGHEVAVHGFEHRHAVLATPWASHDDLARALDTVAAATGAVPCWYRPPYGVLSGGAVLAAARLRLSPVLWSCWGREWTPGASPDSVRRTLLGGLAAGATVLLHDSDCTSPAGSARAALGALPGLLAECERRGLAVGPLSEHLVPPPARKGTA